MVAPSTAKEQREAARSSSMATPSIIGRDCSAMPKERPTLREAARPSCRYKKSSRTTKL
ncbi:hypothetical protein D3C75_1269790 [compost metagenome]